MGLLLVTVALVSALVSMRLAVHGREIHVPDLRGKTPSEARRLAENLGLAAQAERQYYSATVPEGRVLSQTPGPDTLVRRGWEVRLALSLGPQRVTIPQVVGQSQRAATIVLQQRGLDNSVAEINVPGATLGEVLAQDPPANASNVAAPRVSLLVAQEPSPGAYVMPSFVGRSLGSAALAMKDAGFALGKVTLSVTSDVNANAAMAGSGSPAPNLPPHADASTRAQTSSQNAPTGAPSPASIVVSQQPLAGQKVLAGAEIRLVVR